MLGREMLAAMSWDHEVMGVTRLSLDLGNLERVRELMVRYRPVAVIHCEGVDDLDYCEGQAWEAMHLNVAWTHNVVLACHGLETALALPSTSEIFCGLKSGPYTEWDAPDPPNVYGHTKAAAEMLVRDHLTRFHICRTQGLFSRHGHGFVQDVLHAISGGQPVTAAGDEFILPTHAADYAAAVCWLVRNQVYGTFHLTSTGPRGGISCADWARLIANAVGAPEYPVAEAPAASLLGTVVAGALAGRRARRAPRAILGSTMYRLRGHVMPTIEESLYGFLHGVPSAADAPAPVREDVEVAAGGRRPRKAGLVYGPSPGAVGEAVVTVEMEVTPAVPPDGVAASRQATAEAVAQG